MRAKRRALFLALPLLIAAGDDPPLFQGAEPADGSTVRGNPHWVALHFGTNVAVTALALTDAAGRPVPLGWPGPAEPATEVRALLPDDLPPGTYDLRWVAHDLRNADEDTPATDWQPPGPSIAGQVRFTVAP